MAGTSWAANIATCGPCSGPEAKHQLGTTHGPTGGAIISGHGNVDGNYFKPPLQEHKRDKQPRQARVLSSACQVVRWPCALTGNIKAIPREARSKTVHQNMPHQ